MLAYEGPGAETESYTPSANKIDMQRINPVVQYDSLDIHQYVLQTVRINQDPTTLCRVSTNVDVDEGAMADTGANMCMGPCHVSLLGIRIHPIGPVPVGLAVKSDDPT